MPESATPKTRARTNGTAQKRATTRRSTPRDPVARRLSELRELALSDPGRAQRDTWAWIRELGKARDGEQLAKLFGLGTPPTKPIDGPTDGILVTTLTNPLVDIPVRIITGLWMPWMGKSFDPKTSTGINRMTGTSRLPSKLLWPLYRMRDATDGKLAFDFLTGVERGKIAPEIDVLKIDYEPVKQNPRLVIRQIRDELVELVPNTHLGRILFKLPIGGYRNIGYFALRQPAG
jgi:hypothetical protein